MSLVRVNCQGCGTSFVSAHQHDRAALTEEVGPTREERCPHCGTVGTYRPADYGTPALGGPRVSVPSGGGR